MKQLLKTTLFALTLAGAVTAYAQPQAGDWEFTLGGGGNTFDDDFDSGVVGINGSFGYFYTPNFEIAVRQDIGFADTGADEEWRGRTMLALDYHFTLGKFVPFIGAVGGLDYNEDDSRWGVGPEVGFKYYVHERTFLYARADYFWMFDDIDRVDDESDSGTFGVTFGVGFNIGGR